MQLQARIPDASPEQIAAWDESIARLQTALQSMDSEPIAEGASTILEYELPYESRRIDIVLLIGRSVVVIEAKGKSDSEMADLDQVRAYARDLRCYHRECHDREVLPVLLLTRRSGAVPGHEEPMILGPDVLADRLVAHGLKPPPPVLTTERFLADDAYRPLPSLLESARRLMRDGDLPRIHRAHAATEPTVERISEIIHEAAQTRTRRLILLAGAPGAGKTLVGLRIVHAHFLDDLAVDRADGGRGAPAVFLSGNGPLVEVLQYELSKSGGGGKAFVRGVKDYVKAYSSRRSRIPPEHVLVFDEAQRAWDAEHARFKHGDPAMRSEPEHFIEFAERIPGWCVVLGLIGGGQEINVGEEGGVSQWARAIADSPRRGEWVIHAPPGMKPLMDPPGCEVEPRLTLDTSIRFHAAWHLHRFVAELVEGGQAAELAPMGRRLANDGYHLRLTRNLQAAKEYLWKRYKDQPERRFGLLHSARDRDLARYGIERPQRRFRGDGIPLGPWYGEPQDTPTGVSCRHLRLPVTEFEAQGLELDAALVAWGSDFLRVADPTAAGSSTWSIAEARRLWRPSSVKSPLRLRQNAYRVLLTRGREATVVFVPPEPKFDCTAAHLQASGFLPLEM